MNPLNSVFPENPSPLKPKGNTCNYLSNEDFDYLIKSLILLRISQLRYIVKRFSIPASGNKTKLIALMASVFHSLRYDSKLVEIFQEINHLISQHDFPANNLCESIKTIELVSQDILYFPQSNPLYEINTQLPIFGPLLIPSGLSSGSFTFSFPTSLNISNSSYLLTFLFKDGKPFSFSLNLEINGFPLEISLNDPFPQPLDISEYLNEKNLLNIKSIKVQTQMQISICEYTYLGLSGLTSQITPLPITQLNISVTPSKCDHLESFSLIPFLSKAAASQNWECPICHKEISLSDISISKETLEFPDDLNFSNNSNYNFCFLDQQIKNPELDWDLF